MKKLFTLITALWVCIFAFTLNAQTTLLATLLHDGDVSIYYGATALSQAYTAAADGDVITLSAGQFDAVNIEKSLTIRGAGMGIEELDDVNYPTIINGQIYIKASSTLEGLKFLSQVNAYADVTANMCWFNYFYESSSTNYILEHKLSNCVFDSFSHYNSSLSAINCKFSTTLPGPRNNGHGTYLNCVCEVNTFHSENYKNCTYQNCIIKFNQNIQRLSSSCQVYNSIICCYTVELSSPYKHPTNTLLPDVSSVFKDSTFYELKDEYKNILGSDGTQVGIYGGNIGFSQTPNIPQINKFQVSPRTSADGKLSVEIEVQGIE